MASSQASVQGYLSDPPESLLREERRLVNFESPHHHRRLTLDQSVSVSCEKGLSTQTNVTLPPSMFLAGYLWAAYRLLIQSLSQDLLLPLNCFAPFHAPGSDSSSFDRITPQEVIERGW